VRTSLRAGQVAEAVGLNVETLRYYERRGIIAEPERSPGGHRLYSTRTVTDLRVIKAAQRLGFTLEEAAELLAVGRGHRSRRTEGLQARTTAKLEEVEQRISDLEEIRANLIAATDASCDDLIQCADTECCPIPFTQLTEQRLSSSPPQRISWSGSPHEPSWCQSQINEADAGNHRVTLAASNIYVVSARRKDTPSARRFAGYEDHDLGGVSLCGGAGVSW